MAGAAAKSVAMLFLILNLVMYGIVSIIAGWAIEYGIKHTDEEVSSMFIPVRLFPIYFPIGNFATGFFIMFSLIAGVVGIATSVSGINNILQWNAPNLLSAAASSITSWVLTLLAMGLACKEINIGPRDSNLRALETFIIILSGTQLVCTGAIHAGVSDVINRRA